MARCAYVGAAFAALIAALVAVRLAGTQSGADLGTGTMFDRIAPHYDRANGGRAARFLGARAASRTRLSRAAAAGAFRGPRRQVS